MSGPPNWNWLARVTNSHDAGSRLLEVSDRTNSAHYSYLTDSPLVQRIAFKQSGATRLTTTKTHDNLNRLSAINSSNGVAGVVSAHAYQLNSANQRTASTTAEGSYWVYQYDALGQVISGKKHWSDGTPVAGQHVILRVRTSQGVAGQNQPPRGA